MSLVLTGRGNYQTLDEQQVTSSFSKRDIVIITDENYPQQVETSLDYRIDVGY